MKIKKTLLCAFMICLALTNVNAQSASSQNGIVSKSDDRVEFSPFWFIQFQDGITYTSGVAPSIFKLMSPEFTLGGGFQFTPLIAFRANFGYGENRNWIPTIGRGFNAEFYQLQGDIMMDVCNLIGGYKHHRDVSVFPFIGVTGNLGVVNRAYGEDEVPDAWQPFKLFPSVRAGLNIDCRITDRVSAIFEGNYNFYADNFNSKYERGIDRQVNLLAGLKYRMGDGYRPSAGYLAAQAAAKEAAIAAEKAAAEKAAAEAEAARLAAEKAAREKAEAERIAAEKAAKEAENNSNEAIHNQKCLEHSCDIFFPLDRSYITKNELPKLEALAQFLKENEDFQVALCGYADYNTGTPGYNMPLSERRVKSVKKKLIELGIPQERIITDFKGDTVQPYELPKENRLVTCRVK